MEKITFSNQKAPRGNKYLNLIIVLVIIAAIFSNQEVRNGIALAFSNQDQFKLFVILLVLATIFVVVVAYGLFFKKNYNDFVVDGEGVEIKNKKIPWNDIKNFHNLGDSQSERFGLASSNRTASFDLHNPYWGMNVYVLVTKSGFLNNSVRLQVSEDRVQELENILASHGIQRESKVKMYFTGVSPLFILFFLIPFGLVVVWFLFFSLSG